MLKIGDVENLSPNASVMLRISTLTAWADLQISSTQQSYLLDVIKPYRATLAVLWIGALRDYAGIKGDSEVLQESAANGIGMDSMYFSLGKEVLLPVRGFFKNRLSTNQCLSVLRPFMVDYSKSNLHLDGGSRSSDTWCYGRERRYTECFS